MKMIKKLGAIALAAILMMGIVLTVPVQAATVNIATSLQPDTQSAQSIGYSLIGNHKSITASISYTGGTGTLRATMTAYECGLNNPGSIQTISKDSDTKNAPGGAYVTANADTSYRIFHVNSILYYNVKINGATYKSTIEFSEAVNVE